MCSCSATWTAGGLRVDLCDDHRAALVPFDVFDQYAGPPTLISRPPAWPRFRRWGDDR